MAFTLVGAVRNLHGYGLKRGEYESASRNAITALSQIRARSVVDYSQESQNILILKELEESKSLATSRVTSQLGTSAIKMCAGPAAGIASKIVNTITANPDNVMNSLVEAGVNEAQNQVVKAACIETSEWAAGYFGDMLGMAVAPFAIGVAGVIGLGACAFSETARNAVKDAVTHTALGASSLVSEFSSEGKNLQIITSYTRWSVKNDILQARREEQVQNAAELQAAEEGLSLAQTAHQEIKSTINARREDCFQGFVYWFRNSFLKNVFSYLSSSFAAEVEIQDDLIEEKRQSKLQVKTQNATVEGLNQKIDQLAQKIAKKQSKAALLEESYVADLLEAAVVHE